MQKPGPWILIITIVVVLVFILGIRYGQQVEKTNKTISYVLSIAPTQKPTDVPLNFKTFVSKICGISFLYPSTLKAENATSQSAQFIQNKQTQLAFSCDKKNPFIVSNDTNVATAEVQFQGKKIKIQTKQDNNQKIFFLTLLNPLNVKTIFFQIDEKLLPLLESSLKFSTR